MHAREMGSRLSTLLVSEDGRRLSRQLDLDQSFRERESLMDLHLHLSASALVTPAPLFSSDSTSNPNSNSNLHERFQVLLAALLLAAFFLHHVRTIAGARS